MDVNHYTPRMMNAALELATEWGENFRKPIDSRMLERFPELSTDDISWLYENARKAESFIYGLGERELNGQISENDIVRLARCEFAWLAAANADRLKGIAMFYARK